MNLECSSASQGGRVTTARSQALLAAALAALSPGLAHGAAAAAAPPNPSAIGGGLIQKGQDFEKAAPSPTQPPVVSGPAPRNATPPSTGPGFHLAEVRFPPSRFLKAAELNALAAPLIGKTVAFADLQRLVDRINALYAKRGVLTGRAFIGPQRVVGGVVRIDLEEATLGVMTVKRGAYTRAAYAAHRVKLKHGDVIDMGPLSRQINRFNRTNDSQVQAALSPGKDPGQTDILLSLKDPPRNGLQLFVDNNGYATTGRIEGGAYLRGARLLMDGDRGSIYVNGSRGSVTGTASYNLPVGLAGGRLGVTYAHSDVKVIAGSSASLDVRDGSDTLSVNYARPMIVGNDLTLSAVGAVAGALSSDSVSGRTIGSTRTIKSTLGLQATQTLWRWGRLSGDLSGSYAAVGYLTGTGPSQFWEGSADFTLDTAAWRGLRLHVTGDAQYIDRKGVPGSQLFQLGGTSTLRGYDVGTLSGHSGYFVQAELHGQPPGFLGKYLDPYVFVDTGEVSVDAAHHVQITGAGGGVNLVTTHYVTIQADYAVALDRLTAGQYASRADLKAVLSF